MKVTIEQDFAGWNDRATAEWLRRLSWIYAGADRVTVDNVVVKSRDAEIVAEGEPSAGSVSVTEPMPDPAKKPRKPRADAGTTRGPNKTTTGEPVASEPGVGGGASASVPQPAVPATPTTTNQPPQQLAGKLTIDDARGALGRINQTPGLGMPACMQHLQDFGTNRISLVKEEDFALFIKQADQKIAEHLVQVARDAAKR